MNLDIKTDSKGHIYKRINYDPPGPFNLSVKLSARLVSPANIKVAGQLDIDGADGKPSNRRKAFRLETGDRVELGTWRFDGKDNVIVLSGQTDPPRPHTLLEFELEAEL